jgi:hypothetical protein
LQRGPYKHIESDAESSMKRPTSRVLLFAVVVGLPLLWWPNAQSQQKPESSTVQVHVVITDEAVREDQELPLLQLEDVKVKEGKNSLKVTQLIPAKGENAALQLMILMDDTLNPSVGNSLTDIKEFINAQPPSTVIAVGYMANAGVNVVQNFTADHDLAVKAVRLPRGSISTMDSPYLSLISLVKGWPPQNVRREVLMVSDGIDGSGARSPSCPVWHQITAVSITDQSSIVGIRLLTTGLPIKLRQISVTRACLRSASMLLPPVKSASAITCLCTRSMRLASVMPPEAAGTKNLV